MIRRRVRWVMLLGFAMAAIAIGQQANPPKALPFVPPGFPKEEEDPISPGIVKKVELDDDGNDANVPKGATYYKLRPIVNRIPNTKDESLRQFYKQYSFAFDRINEADGKKTRILPLSKYREQKYPQRFGVYELTDQNQPRQLIRAFELGRVLAIRHFEEIVVEQARELTKSPTELLTNLTPGQRTEIAESLLLEAFFFHGWAVDQGKRKGPGWDVLKKALAEELAITRGKRLKQAVADKDWPLARTLGTRLLDTYGSTPERLEEVYSAKLAEAEAILDEANERASELERVYLLLGDYEARSPNPDRKRMTAIRAKLSEASKKRTERADQLQLRDKGEAGRLIAEAKSFDPDNPKVVELSSALNIDYSILGIGVTRLPERMSPAMLRFDSERFTQELLFEGLIEPVPDEQLGTTFRPVLALARPEVIPNGRMVFIDRSATWSFDRTGFDVADVRGTFDLLQKSRESWPAFATDWLTEARAEDPTRVKFTLKRGHIDPRALLSFKILPARWLQAQGKGADDMAFAAKPFGTGPFTLADSTRANEVLFRANPAYGRRSERPGQPSLKEIRFVNLNEVRKPLNEMLADRIHIIPDVPTIEAETYRNQKTASGRTINIYTTRDNRRLWMLAINHRNLVLRDTNLRRGLMHGIDREAILEEVYRLRGAAEKSHIAMSGPFPPNSWVAPKPLSIAGKTTTTVPPLSNRDLASSKFAEFLKAQGNRNLSLLYPSDDNQAKRTCELIKKQVEELAKADANALVIRLEGLTAADFYRRVYEEHNYDLAYTTFDYPDDYFPLGLAGLLDPAAAGRNGRNMLGYLVSSPTMIPSDADRTLGKQLAEVMLYRDPERIVTIANEIHAKFNDVAPFIPLWQLDRNMAISSAVKPFTDESPTKSLSPRSLDATRLLQNIGRWRVE